MLVASTEFIGNNFNKAGETKNKMLLKGSVERRYMTFCYIS